MEVSTSTWVQTSVIKFARSLRKYLVRVSLKEKSFGSAFQQEVTAIFIQQHMIRSFLAGWVMIQFGTSSTHLCGTSLSSHIIPMLRKGPDANTRSTIA